MQRVAPIAAILARRWVSLPSSSFLPPKRELAMNSLSLTHGRAYATATESVRSSGAAVASGMVSVGKAASESPSAGGDKAEVFWMRDPKTGYWIPENRFEEVDVAELRELLLSKK